MSNEAKFFPENVLRETRSRFCYVGSDPFSGQRVWLDSASGSLRLRAAALITGAQTEFPDQLGRANPGSRHAGELLSRGLEDVKLFLGARSGTVAPAMSSTHAVFRTVDAILRSHRGSNVVTTDLEHPCTYDSTWYFAKNYGKEWRVAHLNPETGFVDPEAILNQVDRDTCLIAMVHGSNMTGAVLDVATVAKEARKISPDVFVLVDGVQYAPHAPVDVHELDVDAYVFGPYKVFCSKGIGFAYLSERTAVLDHWRLRGNAQDSWSLGSAEEATYGAWSAVVDYLVWLGGFFTKVDDRRARVVAAMIASGQHIRALLERLVSGTESQPGVARMGHVRLHGVTPGSANRLCLLLLSIAGMTSSEAVELYNSAGVRVHNRVKDAYSRHTLEALGIEEAVRPSACHYNSPADIDRFLEVTAQLPFLTKSGQASSAPGSGPLEG